MNTTEQCPRVAARIECPECGYPACEARYLLVEEFQSSGEAEDWVDGITVIDPGHGGPADEMALARAAKLGIAPPGKWHIADKPKFGKGLMPTAQRARNIRLGLEHDGAVGVKAWEWYAGAQYLERYGQ